MSVRRWCLASAVVGLTLAGLAQPAGAGVLQTAVATPAVYSASPSSLPPGVTSQLLDIQGASFSTKTKLSFGTGVTLDSLAYDSSTELSAEVDVATAAPLGYVSITATNPKGQTGSCQLCFAVPSTPQVTEVFPSEVSAGDVGDSLDVYGQNFEPDAAVSFSPASGITVTSTTYVSPEEVDLTVDVASTTPPQFDDVIVTNTGAATSGTCTQCLEVLSNIPVITQASPSSLPQGFSNQDVYLYGENFDPGMSVTVPAKSGVKLNSVTYQDNYDAVISVSVTAKASLSSVPLTIKTAEGTSTCTTCFAVSDTPAPSYVSVESSYSYGGAASLPDGASDQYLDVSGQSFMPTAKVTAPIGSGITVGATSFESSTLLVAEVSIASTAPEMSDTLTVTNPGGQSSSCTTCFAVSDTPQIGYVAPSQLTADTANQDLYIYGSDFIPGTTVSFPVGSGITVDSTRYESPGQVIANVDVAASAPIQQDTITMTNPIGATPAGSCTTCFSVVSQSSVISVSEVYPYSLPDGASYQDLTIYGTAFVPGATVTVPAKSDITVNSTSFESSTELIASISIATSAPERSASVTVTDPTSGSPSATCTGCLVISDTPEIDYVESNNSFGGESLPPGARNQDIYIGGQDFMPGADVTFPKASGVSVNTVHYENPGLIVANVNVSAKAPVAAATVAVTNPTGKQRVTSCSTCFAVSNIPAVYGAEPSSLSVGTANQDLDIYGSDYMPGATVSFPTGSGITINSTRYESPGNIIANITVSPSAPQQTDEITVTNKASGSPSGSCLTCLQITS